MKFWFIEEEIADDTDNMLPAFSGKNLITAGGKISGNLGPGKNRKMVCALTGGKSSKAEMLSLANQQTFYRPVISEQAVAYLTAPRFRRARYANTAFSGSGLQQPRQSVNIRLNRPGGDVALCTWPGGSPAGCCRDTSGFRWQRRYRMGSSDASGMVFTHRFHATRALPLASKRAT